MFNMKGTAPTFPDDEPIGQGPIDISASPPDLRSLNPKLLPIKARIIKHGNSAAIVIPASIAKSLNFKIGDYVVITAQVRNPDPDELERERRKKRKA